MKITKRTRAVACAMIAVMLISATAAPARAVSVIDWILYKEASLKTGTKVLVNRITGEVGYFWQQGMRWGDADYDEDKGGSWKVPPPALKSNLQAQYNGRR